MKNVITMVGISVFKNWIKDKGSNTNYSRIENKSYAKWTEYLREIDSIQKYVLDWAIGKKNASAEIASLLKIQTKYNSELKVYLLASDTILSALAAKIIQSWFKESKQPEEKAINFEFDSKLDVLAGLMINNPAQFKKEGLLSLFKRLEDFRSVFKKNMILNITGGFKAVVPFLSIFGQLYKIPTFYIYEDEEELIDLPNLPINLDISDVEDYYTAFVYAAKEVQNQLQKNEFLKYLDNNPQRAEAIFNRFVAYQIFKVAEDEKVTLTVYGKMMKNYYDQRKSENIGNIIGSLVELRLYEYFMNKFSNKTNFKILHSETFDEFEADLLIVDYDQKEITIIECKPGGNIPFDDIRTQKIEKLLPKVINKYPNLSVKFHIYCYRDKAILDSLKFDMQRCNDLAIQNSAKKMKWYWIRTEKSETTPLVENNLIEIKI